MLSNYGDFDENSLNNIIAPDGNINEDDHNDVYDLIRNSSCYSDEQIRSHCTKRRHIFSIPSMNIVSLNTKLDQLKTYVELLKTLNCVFVYYTGKQAVRYRRHFVTSIRRVYYVIAR